MKPTLFDIQERVVDSIDVNAVLATATDIIEMDMFVPPFENFFIRISMRLVLKIGFLIDEDCQEYSLDETLKKMKDKWGNENLTVKYNNFEKRDGLLGCGMNFEVSNNNGYIGSVLSHFEGGDVRSIGNIMLALFIVLMATKNIERRIVTNDARANNKRARDDAKHFSTTTYLNIGKIVETCRGTGGSLGGPIRPHLRRGHIRAQRYGEGLREVKNIFVRPVFVNADKDWVEQQKTYKFTGSFNPGKSDGLTISE